jgi:hypothetical protein
MSTLSLKFNGIDTIIKIEIDSTTNAEFFKEYLKSFNRAADRIYYIKSSKQIQEEFLTKAHVACKLFNFNWYLTNLTQDNFNTWHRDIETFDLSKHPPWSEEKGNFFIDLHQYLHYAEPSNQSSSTLLPERHFIQIKWFSESIPWPEKPIFIPRTEIRAGDVITDFPHVGKSPWVSFLQNDVENLQQSCKLPNACPPGMNIVLTNYFKGGSVTVQQKQLVNWYQKNIDQLATIFTQEEMLTYDGEYRIGYLKNAEDLQLLKTVNLTDATVI